MRRLELDTPIAGPQLLEPKLWGDRRGFFMETYRRDVFAALGIPGEFVQDNHSSSSRGVLRGLHYQRRRPQAKLVRVLRGCVLDVALDVRPGSPTFGRHVAVELSEGNRRVFYVPPGFAHGFLVRSETAEFAYKCSTYYAPAEERGIRWDDPALGIDWGTGEGFAPTLSDKDRVHPLLAEVKEEDWPVLED